MRNNKNYFKNPEIARYLYSVRCEVYSRYEKCEFLQHATYAPLDEMQCLDKQYIFVDSNFNSHNDVRDIVFINNDVNQIARNANVILMMSVLK